MNQSDRRMNAKFRRALNLAEVVMQPSNRESFFLDLGFVEHIVGLSKGI
jgi:hypothetical protein